MSDQFPVNLTRGDTPPRTATPGSSKKEYVNPSGQKSINPSGQGVPIIVAEHLYDEEAKVVVLMKTKKHVPLPFRLITESGR